MNQTETPEGRAILADVISFPVAQSKGRTKKTARVVPCHHCGRLSEKQPNQILRAKFQFCSRACKQANPDFAVHAARRNGDKQRYRGEGRSYVKFNGRHMHRVVAEQKLGRKLLPGEIVHHIDGNRRNNHPDNLQVTTQSEHMRLHLPELMQAQGKQLRSPLQEAA